ncbi:hypothetical protein ACOMHN_036010 [Nucella lapillus]
MAMASRFYQESCCISTWWNFLTPEWPYDTSKYSSGSQSEPYTCPQCGTVVTHRNNISRHRRKCERKCHLKCEDCGKEFYRRDNYQDHLWNRHRKTLL